MNFPFDPLLALLPLLMLTPVVAGAVEPGEFESARAALESGAIQPLQRVLKRLESTFHAQVVEAELERHGGRWVYEIKLLPANEPMRELKVDARSGVVLERNDHNAARERGGERGRERERR